MELTTSDFLATLHAVYEQGLKDGAWANKRGFMKHIGEKSESYFSAMYNGKKEPQARTLAFFGYVRGSRNIVKKGV